MWSIARFDLGLTDKEFGKLTLKKFEALLDRKMEADKRERLNFGIVAAMIYNCAPFADEKREPMKATDFVPGMRIEQDLSKMSPEEQKQYFMNMFTAKKMTKK